MYPSMFFGSPCDFGPRGHNGPFPHHHPPMGHHHPPMGHHHPPVGHHHPPMGHHHPPMGHPPMDHHHPPMGHPPMGHHHPPMGHPPMGHHHPPMGHQHHPMGPHSRSMGFDHHLKGPHHHRWGPYHAPRGPHHHQTRPIFSKCPLRGPTGHSEPFVMRHRRPFGMGHPRPFGIGHPGPFSMGPPGHFGAWSMLHASTDDEWLNNTCSMEGCGECSDEETLPQSSPTNQQQTSVDENDHDKEQQQTKDCDAKNSDLWMNAEEGVWSTEVFIGPYAESEVKVLGEGQDGVKVEASHLHGENVVALMMRRLPPPSRTSYTITHTFSRPFVTITATKSTDGVDAAEHLLKKVNLADEADV